MRLDRGRPEAGFTLLEMIVVLAVLGLVLLVVLGRGAPHSPGLDCRLAARAVAQQLREARADSIATDRPVRVELAEGARSLRVDGREKRALPGAAAIGAGSSRAILFRPDGGSSGGAVVLAEGSVSARAEVDWLTGTVSVR
ncbi:GspH/FimT family pseudopilin [Rhizosaccharibacter radicis]|uniref:Type II secretion system protein H n=1 Tax=Rhizosaccharibacter radicis TaxID=2782605 RepID=A0ABT1VT38_9PROT|nr:prepilin-type N-terminal cleavage/methylation domain-containing protein [Acetobacteraceae bacterium KSS12]